MAEGLDESPDILTTFDVGFSGIPDDLLKQLTVQEIMLGESLLTPGLQTSVMVHSHINEIPIKNFDLLKNTEMSIDIEKSLLTKFKIDPNMSVRQTTYRLDNRKLINNNVEEFYIHACDQTLLDNAATLVSKLWKCKSPSTVVRDV